MLHRGAKVLDQHVGPLDEPQQDRVTVFGREVDDDGPLVAMEVRAVGPAGCERDRAGRRTHLHDVGPEVRELAHAGGPGPRHREVDHANAVERAAFHPVSPR